MAIPNYQEIVDLLKDGRLLEAKEKIIELREAALRLQEENLALKEKLRGIDADSEMCAKMNFDKGVYWLSTPTDDGTNVVGPFCQVCHDKDKRPVRLHRNSNAGGGWFCAVCRNHF
jgi:hypothetical protein